MMKFSANLGFLYTHIPLIDAVYAARADGFDAVELHWPYDTDPVALRDALRAAQLPVMSINTQRGDPRAGDMGLSAVPGRSTEARNAIDQALEYAQVIGAKYVHVMAGIATGPKAERAFLAALEYASDQAQKSDQTILIEALNPFDVPGYFLTDTTKAQGILRKLGRDNVKLMFDCYHVARTEGDVLSRLDQVFADVGHVQIASVPDRGAPHAGDVDYRKIFKALQDRGWQAPIGAEFLPGPDGAVDLRFMAL